MGCVCHDPRLSGHVCHNPQTTAAGPQGMGATTPVYRGMCATTPKKGHASRRVLAATRHTATVASITRRRAEQAGRLGDLAVMDLSVTEWHSSVPALVRAGPWAIQAVQLYRRKALG